MAQLLATRPERMSSPDDGSPPSATVRLYAPPAFEPPYDDPADGGHRYDAEHRYDGEPADGTFSDAGSADADSADTGLTDVALAGTGLADAGPDRADVARLASASWAGPGSRPGSGSMPVGCAEAIRTASGRAEAGPCPRAGIIVALSPHLLRRPAAGAGESDGQHDPDGRPEGPGGRDVAHGRPGDPDRRHDAEGRPEGAERGDDAGDREGDRRPDDPERRERKTGRRAGDPDRRDGQVGTGRRAGAGTAGGAGHGDSGPGRDAEPGAGAGQDAQPGRGTGIQAGRGAETGRSAGGGRDAQPGPGSGIEAGRGAGSGRGAGAGRGGRSAADGPVRGVPRPAPDDESARQDAALQARRRAAALRASPAARAAAQRFVGVCVEVLGGHRPISHLRAVTSTADLARVTDQVIRRTTRAHLARPTPPGTRPHRVRLRSLHVCEPVDGVAEVAAVLEYGPRVWAMAVRLERHGESWLCTLVQVL
ncbi:hypothetical protein Val02_79270 [Virgisporangium aliadipatigenens]|uniref:Uncharacterized protein n=1 Tax=Virgisporangium aliadipatigenens TaxID=741659 RepID=A0A8J4DV36_9ACTN|nr:Rv3235 family protein [Virgisporangium aliadipatigenens]GIJ51041.1 hypothetical protein Val02_79270 [Virgisporangium aliadipatigenens]